MKKTIIILSILIAAIAVFFIVLTNLEYLSYWSTEATTMNYYDGLLSKRGIAEQSIKKDKRIIILQQTLHWKKVLIEPSKKDPMNKVTFKYSKSTNKNNRAYIHVAVYRGKKFVETHQVELIKEKSNAETLLGSVIGEWKINSIYIKR